MSGELAPALEDRRGEGHRARNHQPQRPRARGPLADEVVVGAAPLRLAQEQRVVGGLALTLTLILTLTLALALALALALTLTLRAIPRAGAAHSWWVPP